MGRKVLAPGYTVEKVRFEEVTQEAGLEKIWMRAPHGELRDFDNDGWQDLLTSVMVDSTDGGHDPLIYRNPGTTAGDTPRDRRPIWIRWPATGRGTPRTRH